MSEKVFLGIDIGGTKISVSLGTADGRLLGSRRFAVADVASSYPAGVAAITQTAAAVLADAKVVLADVAAVGIAAPAPMDNKRGLLLAPTNLKGWGEAPIVADVAARFQKPVRMYNDANACALAEMYFGAGRGVKNLVYLTASTGMGGGIIVDGQLLEGPDDTAGEVGHFVLDPDGPLCACGQRGCFEAFCGGLSTARRIQARLRAQKTETAILRHAGGTIDEIAFPALLAALREGDALAQEIWAEYTLRMAQGIGIIIMTLNPDLIVLGTIAIHAGALLLQPLQELLPRFAWDRPLKRCKIVTSPLGVNIGDYAALAAAVAAAEPTASPSRS